MNLISLSISTNRLSNEFEAFYSVNAEVGHGTPGVYIKAQCIFFCDANTDFEEGVTLFDIIGFKHH